MANNQRYYYLRLKENFFDSPELKTIEKMRGGYKYSNILLKLYLLSLRDEGRLTLRKNIPYDVSMLANLVGFSKIEVENALKIFREFELIDILDSGTIYMLDIQNYIGTSSTEADRQRTYQRRLTSEKCKKSYEESCDISTPEIEIDIDIDTERDPEKESLPAPTVSLIPNMGEVETYFKDHCLNGNASKFFYYYSASGWTRNGAPITDWKALANVWSDREKSVVKVASDQDDKDNNVCDDEFEQLIRKHNVLKWDGTNKHNLNVFNNGGNLYVVFAGAIHVFPEEWLYVTDMKGWSIEEFIRYVEQEKRAGRTYSEIVRDL